MADLVGGIGDVAGVVYRELSRTHGRKEVGQLKKAVHADETLVYMAVGWLAREGKIVVELENQVLVHLRGMLPQDSSKAQ